MKSFTNLFACITFIFIFLIAIFSQTPTDDWARVQSDNGEFSIEMPKNPTYFYDKDGFAMSENGNRDYQYSEMQMLNGSSGKSVMIVEIYKVASPKAQLNLMLDQMEGKSSKFNVPKDFIGKQLERKMERDNHNNKDVEISFASVFVASKNYLYVISVGNRGQKTKDFERFLSSIRFGGSQNNAAKISTFTAVTVENIGEDSTNEPAIIPDLTVPAKPKVDNPTPFLLLTKPKASYTIAARKEATIGSIRLRTRFEKDGRISKISILKGLPNGLTRSAFFSALRIKFIPQENEGELKTLTKTIEYSFAIY